MSQTNKIRAGQIETKTSALYNGTSASTLGTASATPVQVGTAEVTFTTKGGNFMLTGYAPMFMSSGVVNGYLGLQTDGSNGTEAAFISLTATRTVIVKEKRTLAAGTHTVKLTFRIDGGHTISIPAYNTFTLEVIEI